jgi:plasmid stabilization system protein ParE
MRYTVVWKPPAEEELTRIWTAAPNRNEIAAAANEIDRLLRSDPHGQGESRTGQVRVTFVAPLGVFFHIEDRDRLVSVLRVWCVG